jgi:hypothetical protein
MCTPLKMVHGGVSSSTARVEVDHRLHHVQVRQCVVYCKGNLKCWVAYSADCRVAALMVVAQSEYCYNFWFEP